MKPSHRGLKAHPILLLLWRSQRSWSRRWSRMYASLNVWCCRGGGNSNVMSRGPRSCNGSTGTWNRGLGSISGRVSREESRWRYPGVVQGGVRGHNDYWGSVHPWWWNSSPRASWLWQLKELSHISEDCQPRPVAPASLQSPSLPPPACWPTGAYASYSTQC